MVVQERHHTLQRAEADRRVRAFIRIAIGIRRCVEHSRGKAETALERRDVRFRGVRGRDVRVPDRQPVPERFDVTVDDRHMKLVRVSVGGRLRSGVRVRASPAGDQQTRDEYREPPSTLGGARSNCKRRRHERPRVDYTELRRARSVSGVGFPARETYVFGYIVPMLADLPPDLVFAARLLRKSPGFTLVAAVSLALAIGANTTIFSVGKQLLFDRLDVPDAIILRLLATTPTSRTPSTNSLRAQNHGAR